jgi:hypothetical protein
MTSDERELLATIRLFLHDTPPELLDADPATWQDLFPTRLAFEAWRQRWLAYCARMADGPTDPREYAALRPRLFSMPATDRVDRFHA